MKAVKAVFLLCLMITAAFVHFAISPVLPVRAVGGQAKVYIVCLPEVWGWTFEDRLFDPSLVKDGALDALDFKEKYQLPQVHPKYEKTPPFFDISYSVVTSWTLYQSIIESYENVIVINTHGEIVPVPSDYASTPYDWIDKIAEAMLTHRVTWVHTAGWPFYYYWAENALEKTALNETGFQRLMGHIGFSHVTCYPKYAETDKIPMNDHAEENLENGGWKLLGNAIQVEHGRPLNCSDFKDYIVLPIWGTDYGYATGAVVAFVKPNERYSPEDWHGFGAYVHIGTNQTFNSVGQPTEADYMRGYAGAAVAVWTEALAFEHTETNRVYDYGLTHTELLIRVIPVIAGYHTESNLKEVYISFGVYGVMKTNSASSDHFTKACFYLGGVSQHYSDGVNVWMVTDSSKDAYNYPESSTINWPGVGRLGLKTLLFILPIVLFGGVSPFTPIGGFMLFTDWLTLDYYGNPPTGAGVDDESSSYVDFEYNPKEHYESADGCTFWEFESLIYTKVKINESLIQQWTIFPLDWKLELWTQDSPDGVPTEVSGGLSFAIYNDYEQNDYSATVFYDDFEGDATADDGYFLGGYEWAWIEWDGWFAMDVNDDSGYDFWNVTAYPWAHRVWCSQMGYHDATYNVPNSQCQRYDTNMYAILARLVDLKPFRAATLIFHLDCWIDDEDDYFQVFYSDINGVWSNMSRKYNGYAYDSYESLTLPTNATAIIFLFYSNSEHPTHGIGYDFNYGVWVDNVEVRAELPNDAINTNQDAGSTAQYALPIAISDSATNYAGYINSDEDCYNFTVSSSAIQSLKRINVTLTSPYGAELVAELYDPNGVLKAGPSNKIDYKLHAIDHPGNWTIKIYAIKGFGQYNFYIGFLPGGGGGGGCPYAYVWDGSSFVVDNNILRDSVTSHGTDVHDYYRLEQLLVPTYKGRLISQYSLELAEFENEHSYIDQIKLFAVDHLPDVKVAVTLDGKILTYKDPEPPAWCIDSSGQSQLMSISSIDNLYYQGYAGSWLLLNFGAIDETKPAKLVMRADAPLKYMSIHIQILNSSFQWQPVEVIHPREKWATEIVDLSSYLEKTPNQLMIRLYFTANHKIDFIGLDTTKQEDLEVHEAYMLLAIHSTQGNVKWKLAQNDNIYAELVPGENIKLAFVLLNSNEEERTFILYTEGRYQTIQNNG